MYDQGLLDRIRAAVDIAALVGEYVPLQKAGATRWKACCPFHKEKTPSFFVNGALQIFKCFGCGAGGNAATFLMKAENITFPEAVRRLAERAHIPLPESDTPEDKERRRLLQVVETAAALYARALKTSPEAARARDYLAKRKIGAEAVEQFRLGWCAGNEMASTKMHPALLDRAGLTAAGPGGRYERFRNRLVIPITDESGHTIGFGGRTLEDIQPKYINSPETPLYSKSRCLFAFSQAKEPIRKAGAAFLVEGYFDAIAMHVHNIRNTVAVLGTSLTEAQIGLLKRLATRLFIVYDEDAGGNEAALRGLDLASAAGLEVRIVRLPAGRDPDEFLEERGEAAFLEATKESEGGAETGGAAVHLFEFRIEVACRHADPRTETGKVRIVNELIPFLVRVPNAIERNFHVRRLAERLGLRESDIEEEVNRARAKPERGPVRPAPAALEAKAKPSPAWRAERLLLGGVLSHRTSAVDALLGMPPGAFDGVEARKLAGRLRELFEKGEAFSVSSLMDEFQDSPGVLDLLTLAEPEEGSASADAAIRDAVRMLAGRRKKARLREIQDELVRTTDPEKVSRLLEEKQKLAAGD